MFVGHDLENQAAERDARIRGTRLLVTGLRVDSLNRRDVEWRRQIIDDGIEQGLHAFVLERRTRNNRH